MCTTGSEDAVTIQAGTFSWDRNERPILEKCVCVCVYVRVHLHECMHLCMVCICIVSFIQLVYHLQYQSEHQAWSVGGSSGSRGSW